MNKKDKNRQILTAAVAVIAAVLLVVSALVSGLCAALYMYGQFEMTSLVVVLCACAMIAPMTVMSIDRLNRLYDEKSYYVSRESGLKRWARNALFAAMLAGFAGIMGIVLRMGRYTPEDLYRVPGLFRPFFIMAIGFFVFLESNSYRRTRGKRVRDLIRQNSLYKDRRFYFVVEKIGADGLLFGTLSGTVRKNDKVYVLNGNAKPFTAEVVKIYTRAKAVNEASDAIVCIEISEKEAALVRLYAVISDVYPSVTKWPQNHVENPRLRGMIQGYRNQFDRKEYMEQMMLDTVRSFYLVPAKLQAVEDFDGDIMDTLRKNASVRFFAVMTKNIPDAEALPVFTDWEALSHYRELMGQERAITVVMDFSQMTDILNQGYSAVVVNAFGPQPFYLSKEYIAMIKKTEISDKNENQEKE